MEKRYKKCRAIHKVAYISLFIYLLVLSLGNISFGEYNHYFPYFIVIPFLGYCIIAIIVEILARKNYRAKRNLQKQKTNKTVKHEGAETPELSKI